MFIEVIFKHIEINNKVLVNNLQLEILRQYFKCFNFAFLSGLK